jgi:exopolyphosphatase/guanosine-5'-triphosphate,3'-diphosphate pyrophosphatase
MAASPAMSAKEKPTVGLRPWMERVLQECDRTVVAFEPDPVHDLRVSLRRCRSLADGLMAIDPDPSWKAMKKAGRKLFQALGGLRDMHVLQQWIEKLGDPADPVTQKLLEHVHLREAACKHDALGELNQFDRKQWRQWSRKLPRRAARIRLGSVVFRHLALEKWTAAYALHRTAMRSRSQVALHQLRIGIKRFRYTVENFLPQQHAAWGNDLKELQDLLGEVHDLDVLWTTALEIKAFADPESRARWRAKIIEERAKRVAGYREKMIGKKSLWQVWRAELPSGPQLRAAAMNRLGTWASYLDPDFAHSRRVAQVSLMLYDGLKNVGLVTSSPDHDSRAILHAAALMHDVGKVKGNKSHQKASARMIRKLALPLGWSPRELQLAAVVARYHRGALPRPGKPTMQRLELADRHVATELAGVLRLANCLDMHNGTPQLRVEVRDPAVVLHAAGYSALNRNAQQVAGARHLLETTLKRPVIVRPLRTELKLMSRSRARG